MSIKKVVIVGAGQSGGRAAALLRQEGFEGTITLIGSEPHAPYERPPLSKAVLKGEKTGAECALYGAEFFGEQNIETRFGATVAAIDATAKSATLADGETLTYDALVLATGGVVRRLPLSGGDAAGVHVVRTVEDSDALKADLTEGAKIVVIGGGFIGLETAASACQLGCDVTVLEGAPRILGRSVPQVVADTMARLHADKGVEIRCDVRIESFEVAEDRVSGVRLADGEVVPADAVVIGIGIAPGVALAEAAGIPCDNGILVDAFGATQVDGVYATGDCANGFNPRYGESIRLESYQNADMQARTVARSIVGAPQAYEPVPWLWSDQYDWTMQTAGLPSRGDKIITRGSYEEGGLLVFTLEGDTVIGAIGLGEPKAVAKDLRSAQMMMERGVNPSAEALADESIPMRKLMKGG